MDVPENIKEALKQLPDSPGVYMHKDSLGNVIYVGKAVSLRNRVRQYFQSSRNMDPKVRSREGLHALRREHVLGARARRGADGQEP